MKVYLRRLTNIVAKIFYVSRIFGIKERNQDRLYMQEVPDRTGFPLMGVIFYHIVPKSRILSDSWSSYSKISLIKEFSHEIINHIFNFVDPENENYT